MAASIQSRVGIPNNPGVVLLSRDPGKTISELQKEAHGRC
jgi:hypothetical protein